MRGALTGEGKSLPLALKTSSFDCNGVTCSCRRRQIAEPDHQILNACLQVGEMLSKENGTLNGVDFISRFMQRPWDRTAMQVGIIGFLGVQSLVKRTVE